MKNSISYNTGFWLVKSEPETYSISDLQRDGKTVWDGVRNYQARNFMVNDMKIGDKVLFYHSNAEPPAVVGIAEVAGPAIPEKIDLDKAGNPVWFGIQLKFDSKFKSQVPLEKVKTTKGLEKMVLVQRGSRLSIQPVNKSEFQIIRRLGQI